jgi:tetratricopeptide (TPR) repeat protein
MSLRIRAAAVLIACLPALLHAQAGTRRPNARRSAASAIAIRAEYAAVLLQAEKYKEAAKEYRALLEADSNNTAYRLGLARALAWDDHFREADRELSILVRRRATDPAIGALVKTVRGSYEPTVSEAEAWLGERPDDVSYRFALARALVREHRARDAIAQYDMLLATRDSAPLLVGLADAYAAAGDRPAGIERVRAAVARQPADSGIRHAYATVLTSAGQYEAAIAQYDTLVATRPSVGGYLALGDLHRQTGNYAAARFAYDRARVLAPGDARVETAFAVLAREERPVVAFVPDYDGGYRWQASAMTAGDNIGMSYSTLSVRRGVALPRGVSGSIGAELRRLGAHDQFDARYVNGLAADVGASRAFTRGIIGARVGAVAHSSAPTVPYFSAAATGWMGAVGASVEAAAGPSYPSLLTLASLDDVGGEKAITERSLRLSLGGPLQRADVALAAERALMSDGNERTTLEGYARYPLTPGISAVYSLNVLQFAERSPRYWDPRQYVAHALGLEAATRRLLGWSAAVRLLPGVAQADEVGSLARVTAGSGTRTTVGQLTANGELGYRTRTWEFAVAGSYGRGRSGGYQQAGANAVLRLTP